MKPLRSFVCACSLALCAASLQADIPEGLEYQELESGVTITGYIGSATTLDIPASINDKPVTAIGMQAFLENKVLTSVTIPDSVTTIAYEAFSGCTGLTSVTIGNNVTEIKNYAFAKCEALTAVSIPDSVISIGEHAFQECRGLKSVTIGNQVTSIGQWAFGYCTALPSVTIPGSVTTIGVSAFTYCNSLTSVTFENGVTTIDADTFARCENLTSVTIPDSVTAIASGAFDQCSGLEKVVFTGVPPTYETPSDWAGKTWKYPAWERERWQEAIASGRFGEQSTFEEYTVAFDETVPEADREWLEKALEDQGRFGVVTVVGEPSALEAFRPLGVLPQLTQEGTTLTLNVEPEAAFAALRDAAVAGEIYGKAQLDAKVDEIALTAPLIAVGESDVTVEIGFQTAETLGDWQPAALTGATVETSAEGTLRVRLPKPTDSTAAFYKFVVPDGRQP